MTLSANGLVTLGSSSESLHQTGWETDTLTGTTTETDTPWSTISTSMSSAGALDVSSVTATSTLTTSQSDSMTTTLNDLDNVFLGTSATITSGTDTTTLTSTGNDTFNLYETDSDSSNLSGNSTTNAGSTQTSATYSEHLTASPTISDWGLGNSTSSMTQTETIGTNGLFTAGTVTAGALSSVTATYSLSEAPVTTLSESSSETVAASSNGALDQTKETGTLTDTITYSSPSTLTETDGGNMTVGASDVVSGGTSSDSLYETSSDSQPDTETGTLTTTVTGSDSLNDSSSGNQGSLTTTSTLTDSAHTTSGDTTTQTEADTVTIGSAAVIAGGTDATTLWGNGSDSYSLYETGQETYSSGTSMAQGGSNGNSQTDGYTGSGSSTLTTTSTDTYTSTQTATTTLGSNGTITSAGSTDSLYETGNDSVTSDVGSGTRVRQVNYGGGDGQSSTFTTTYSSYDSSADSFTQTVSDVQSLGINGTIASGQDLDTLTSFGSSTYTYTEYGGRTISFAGGGYIGGSYNDYESTSQSYTLSDSTSIALGANGTIASGTVASLTTQVYSDSQSFSEYGAENVPDPEGGPPFSGELTQTSVTTSYAYSVNRGTETLGALGTISGGGNSFSFNQSDYNSLWLSSPESDTASYSMNMAGTETYAPGGAISGGSDNFTWNQNAYDKTTIIYDQLAGTAAETNYEMLVTETVSDTMYDVGSDVLGASDSIVSNGDDYTIIDWQQVTSTIVDSGSSATSFYIYAVGIDDYTTTDAGSSTLSASGQSYGLDTVTFSESTSDNDYDTQSFGTTLYDWGTATDYYTNSDVSTITNSNGVTTSDDAFVMLDTHSVFGGDAGSSVSGTWSEGWTDNGTDVDVSSANGTSSPTAIALTFSNSDSSGDVGLSNESAVGEYTHNGGNNNSAINFTDGTYVSNAKGSDYNTYSSTTFDDSNWITGTEYWMGVSYPVNVGTGTSETLVTTVTGPPPSRPRSPM